MVPHTHLNTAVAQCCAGQILQDLHCDLRVKTSQMYIYLTFWTRRTLEVLAYMVLVYYQMIDTVGIQKAT